MSNHIQYLIDQILSAAKSRNISRMELAVEAGMTVAELDMAREYGDILAAALVVLGEQVGLELGFTAHQSDTSNKEKLINDIKAGVFFHRGA